MINNDAQTVLKKVTIAAFLSIGLLFGTASAADATSTSIGGGKWDYGVSYVTMTTWSNYYHPNKVHSSTACNSNKCKRSAPTPKKKWSKASIRATWGGNTTYWSN